MKDFTANTHGLAWMKHVETIFQSVFDSYGFMRITLPLVESSDLFLKKLGDKIKSEIFTFKNSKNHELALRPEMTSPVIKYFLDNHQNDTLPIRLSYKGKVFRKQSSRPAPGEEFTHIGAEILGVNSLLDDVESITAAWTSIEKLNLTNCVLTLNNLGIIINLVRGLDVDEIFKNHFLENLRTHEAGSSSYQALLEEYATDNTPSEYRELSAILNKLSSDEEKLLLTKLLNMIHPHFSEDQDEADDVVQGVLAKIKRQNQHDSIHRILELCEKLQQVQGSPDKAIQEARSILSSYEISLDKLNDLEFTCQSLISYGIPEDKLRVDFGLGRDIK
ncbi:MAG: ATP phosphoribosyltransferase regulatory subunit, partial [Spirochaetota bacterium]|nr:ATP phosphoribosyltransferase regulatory subunit [Spirochaetota bacterium]